jgi:uncharacterized repeat protein (TIGR01451 family)
MAFLSATGDPTVGRNVLTWTFDALAPGLADTVNLAARVVVEESSVVNSASLFRDGRRIATGTATVVVRTLPSLWLTKRVETPVVRPGEEVDYSITIDSYTDTLGEVTIKDALPVELSYQEGSSHPPAVYDSLAHTLIWTVSDVSPDTPRILTFNASPRIDLSPGEHPLQNIAVASLGRSTFTSNPAEMVVVVPFVTVQKSVDRTVAETGDIISYRVIFRNLSRSDSLLNVTVEDRLPYGFDYINGTAYLDGQRLDPDSLRGRDLVWRFSGLGAGKTRQLTYHLVIGADALSGEGTNTVTASAMTSHGATLSVGPARATVRLRPDLFSQGEVILGRAWVDLNEDGLHNNDEPPVPGVILMLGDGTRIIADRQGRFSIPEVRAGDQALRLLDRNIPSGLEPVSLGTRSADDPWIRFVTVSPSGTAKANFPFRPIRARAPAASLPDTTGLIPPPKDREGKR